MKIHLYYLYTKALAGEDYRVLDVPMEESRGVYGPPYSPLAASGYMEHLVIKPSIGGNYADESHIRVGDVNESHDHAWLISHLGTGADSEIWEYEYLTGFSTDRTLATVSQYSAENPHDYWISLIANPVESYSSMLVRVQDSQGQALTGASYKLKDLKGRVLAMELVDGRMLLYRPESGDIPFKLLFWNEDFEFYDEDAFFTVGSQGLELTRIIGGSYILEELTSPQGYRLSDDLRIDIAPGEKKILTLTYEKIEGE